MDDKQNAGSASTALAPPEFDIDLYDEAVQGDLYPYLHRMRQTAPVVYVPKYGTYYASTYDAVKAALGNWRDFSSEGGIGLIDDRTTPYAPPRPPLVSIDPPDHTPNRRLFLQILSPSVAKRMRADFDRTAHRVLEECLAKDSFDLVSDMIRPFTVTVLADAVGLPQEGREHLLILGEWTLASVGPHDERFQAANDAVQKAGSLEWLAKICQRESLSDVGFGADVYAAADAGDITHETAAALVAVFLFGGVDTTITTLANGMKNFLDHPEQWGMVSDDPDTVTDAFEEMLRFNVPVQQMYRSITEDTEFQGFRLEKGRRIALGIAAANRDPSRFADPDTFDVTRKPSGHFGFGIGIHACVGQMVARMEAHALLAAFAETIESFELVGPAEKWVSGGLSSWRSLPVVARRKTGAAQPAAAA